MPTKSNSLESHYGLCLYWLDATATVKVALFAQKFFQKYPNNTKQARCTRQRDLLVKQCVEVIHSGLFAVLQFACCFLKMAFGLIQFTFGLKGLIIGSVPDLVLDFTFGFVHITFDFIANSVILHVVALLM
jgi:hypothetical protein